MLLAAVAAAVLWMFYDANFAGHQDKYQAIAKYIVFNDNWGTNRGFAWRISWENFKNFPLIHKIFGFGPDTFGIITTFNNYKEMSEIYHVTFDNAHNEYLHFLLTIGAAGLTAYLLLSLIHICTGLRKIFIKFIGQSYQNGVKVILGVNGTGRHLGCIFSNRSFFFKQIVSRGDPPGHVFAENLSQTGRRYIARCV